MTQSPGEYKPSRREVLRPVEYVGGAAIAAIFTGVVTLVVTRDLTLALIGTGGVFIIVLVALALFAMAVKPDASESAELHEHDAPRADGDHDGPPGRRATTATSATPPRDPPLRPAGTDRRVSARGQSRSTSSDAMPVYVAGVRASRRCFAASPISRPSTKAASSAAPTRLPRVSSLSSA